MAASTPLASFLTETTKELELHNVREENDKLVLDVCWSKSGASEGLWNKEGNKIAYIAASKDTVVVTSFDDDLKECQELVFSKTGKIFNKLMISPANTYLVCFSRYKAEEDNVFVIRTSDAAEVCSFAMKGSTIESNFLQFAPNDSFLLRVISPSTIVTHDLTSEKFDINNVQCSVDLANERITSICMANRMSGTNANVAVVTTNDKICELKIFLLGAKVVLDGGIAEPSFTESLPNGGEFIIKWNYISTALLIVIHNEDTSGTSYFGTHVLVHLSIKQVAGEGKPKAKIVHEAQQGLIHDVQWAQDSNEFMACQGNIPPETISYDGVTGMPKLSFGAARRNLLRYHRFGSYFLVGGFGGLAGGLDIWDKETKRLIGAQNVRDTVVCEWSNEALLILCATTCPRLKVDNNIKILNYTGDLLHQKDFDSLFYVNWRPTSSKGRPKFLSSSLKPVSAQVMDPSKGLFGRSDNMEQKVGDRIKQLKDKGHLIEARLPTRRPIPAKGIQTNQGVRQVFGAEPLLDGKDKVKKNKKKIVKPSPTPSPE
eukprot:GHVP01065310.1.p1 GENE.GHVP01065310.1~~GHVP01065310.1.p1  ORF type:complete len:543 (-),score=97.50 GHVP01065310.1:138-1766(-)